MTTQYDTLAEAADHKAVIEIIDKSTLKVQPFGNAVLFNRIARGNLSLGNIATDENGSLRVNVQE